MKGGKQPQGYTIVEVLIFMAVSGMMFIVAAIFISGKQANVQFRQGLFDINTQIRSVINEVSNGEYNPLTIGSCSAPLGGGHPIINTFTRAEQGTNGGASGCIFLGKVMQFNVNNDQTKYDVYTVAARQMDAAGNPVSSFSSAMPIPVTNPIDETVRKTTQGGLTVTHQFLCLSPDCVSHNQIGGFGIFGSFNSSLGTATGSQQSGAQSIVAAVIPGSNFGDSEAIMAGVGTTASNTIQSKTSTISSADMLSSGKFILLCVTDGTRIGSITVGGTNGQEFTTEAKINSVFAVGTNHVC